MTVYRYSAAENQSLHEKALIALRLPLERDDRKCPVENQGTRNRVDNCLGCGSLSTRTNVVINDVPQAINPVEKPKGQQQPVVNTPQRVMPSMLNKSSICLSDISNYVSQSEMSKGQEQEDQATDTHEIPDPYF